MGAVTIVQAKDSRLALITDSGTNIFFEVQVEQYAASLDGSIIDVTRQVIITLTTTPVPYP